MSDAKPQDEGQNDTAGIPTAGDIAVFEQWYFCLVSPFRWCRYSCRTGIKRSSEGSAFEHQGQGAPHAVGYLESPQGLMPYGIAAFSVNGQESQGSRNCDLEMALNVDTVI